MAFTFLVSQVSVEITTIVIFLLTIALAVIITLRYFKNRTRSLLFWSLGIWLFAFGVLLEIFFALDFYSGILIKTYLLIVAILVELLALGSSELLKSPYIKAGYKAFSLASTILLAYYLATSSIGNILTDYIVYGNIPLNVAIVSSLITFPAAIMLVGVALKSYLKKRSNKLLSIMAGVIIVSIAGTLYIAQYPAFLYLSEFVGILALWYGFI